MAQYCSTGGRYGAPMATTRDITYEADGRTMIGTLALPDGTDRRPGILVCHEGPGLDDHARARAARIADELGYVAFALDYHGDGKPITDRNQMMARIVELRADPPRNMAVGTAGLDILRAEPRTDSSVWPPSATVSAARSPWSWPTAAPTSRPWSASIPASPPCTPRTPATSPPRSWPSSAPTTPSSTPTSGAPSRRRCGPAAPTGSCSSTAAPCTPSRTRTPPGGLPRHRLRRGDRPALLAGDGRPVQRGLPDRTVSPARI